MSRKPKVININLSHLIPSEHSPLPEEIGYSLIRDGLIKLGYPDPGQPVGVYDAHKLPIAKEVDSMLSLAMFSIPTDLDYLKVKSKRQNDFNIFIS